MDPINTAKTALMEEYQAITDEKERLCLLDCMSKLNALQNKRDLEKMSPEFKEKFGPTILKRFEEAIKYD